MSSWHLSTASPSSSAVSGRRRQSLVFLNVSVLQQPEAYVGGIDDAFDEKGDLVKASLREFLEGYIKAFATWVEQQKK